MTSTKSFYNRFAAVLLVMVITVTSLFGVFPAGVFQELTARAATTRIFTVSAERPDMYKIKIAPSSTSNQYYNSVEGINIDPETGVQTSSTTYVWRNASDWHSILKFDMNGHTITNSIQVGFINETLKNSFETRWNYGAGVSARGSNTMQFQIDSGTGDTNAILEVTPKAGADVQTITYTANVPEDDNFDVNNYLNNTADYIVSGTMYAMGSTAKTSYKSGNTTHYFICWVDENNRIVSINPYFKPSSVKAATYTAYYTNKNGSAVLFYVDESLGTLAGVRAESRDFSSNYYDGNRIIQWRGEVTATVKAQGYIFDKWTLRKLDSNNTSVEIDVESDDETKLSIDEENHLWGKITPGASENIVTYGNGQNIFIANFTFPTRTLAIPSTTTNGTVSLTATDDNSVISSENYQDYTATFTATPNSNCTVDKWTYTIDGNTIEGISVEDIATISADKTTLTVSSANETQFKKLLDTANNKNGSTITFTPVFKKSAYKITYKAPETEGTVKLVGSEAEGTATISEEVATDGTPKGAVAEALSGYQFVRWEKVNSDNTTTEVESDGNKLIPSGVTEDVTYQAVFELSGTTLFLNSANNGTLSCENNSEVITGTSFTFNEENGGITEDKKIAYGAVTAVPDTGYSFSSWTILDAAGNEITDETEKAKYVSDNTILADATFDESMTFTANFVLLAGNTIEITYVSASENSATLNKDDSNTVSGVTQNPAPADRGFRGWYATSASWTDGEGVPHTLISAEKAIPASMVNVDCENYIFTPTAEKLATFLGFISKEDMIAQTNGYPISLNIEAKYAELITIKYQITTGDNGYVYLLKESVPTPTTGKNLDAATSSFDVSYGATLKTSYTDKSNVTYSLDRSYPEFLTETVVKNAESYVVNNSIQGVKAIPTNGSLQSNNSRMCYWSYGNKTAYISHAIDFSDALFIPTDEQISSAISGTTATFTVSAYVNNPRVLVKVNESFGIVKNGNSNVVNTLLIGAFSKSGNTRLNTLGATLVPSVDTGYEGYVFDRWVFDDNHGANKTLYDNPLTEIADYSNPGVYGSKLTAYFKFLPRTIEFLNYDSEHNTTTESWRTININELIPDETTNSLLARYTDFSGLTSVKPAGADWDELSFIQWEYHTGGGSWTALPDNIGVTDNQGTLTVTDSEAFIGWLLGDEKLLAQALNNEPIQIRASYGLKGVNVIGSVSSPFGKIEYDAETTTKGGNPIQGRSTGDYYLRNNMTAVFVASDAERAPYYEFKKWMKVVDVPVADESTLNADLKNALHVFAENKFVNTYDGSMSINYGATTETISEVSYDEEKKTYTYYLLNGVTRTKKTIAEEALENDKPLKEAIKAYIAKLEINPNYAADITITRGEGTTILVGGVTLDNDGKITSYELLQDITENDLKKRVALVDEDGNVQKDENNNTLYELKAIDPTDMTLTTDTYIVGESDIKLRALFEQKDGYIRIDYVPNYTPEGYYASIVEFVDGLGNAIETTKTPTSSQGQNTQNEAAYDNMPYISEYVKWGAPVRGADVEATSTVNNLGFKFVAWEIGDDLLTVRKNVRTNLDSTIIQKEHSFFQPWTDLLIDSSLVTATNPRGYKTHTVFIADSRQTRNVYIALRVSNETYGTVASGTDGSKNEKLSELINIDASSSGVGLFAEQKLIIQQKIYSLKGWNVNGQFISLDDLDEWYNNRSERQYQRSINVYNTSSRSTNEGQKTYAQAIKTDKKLTYVNSQNNEVYDNAITQYVYDVFLNNADVFSNKVINYVIAVYEPDEPYVAIRYESADGSGHIAEGMDTDTWFLGNQLQNFDDKDPMSYIRGSAAEPVNGAYTVDHWEDPLGNIVSQDASFKPTLSQLKTARTGAVYEQQLTEEYREAIVFKVYFTKVKEYNVKYVTDEPSNTAKILSNKNETVQNNMDAGGSKASSGSKEWKFYCWTDSQNRVVSYDADFSPDKWLIQENADENDDVVFTAKYYYNPEVRGTISLTKKLEGTDETITFDSARFQLYQVDIENETEELVRVHRTENGVYNYPNGSETTITSVLTNDGVLTISNLPLGNYYFVETKAPKGCELSEQKYYFSVSSSETKEITIYNKPAMQTLEITKRVDDYVSAFGEAIFLFKVSGVTDIEQAKTDAYNNSLPEGETKKTAKTISYTKFAKITSNEKLYDTITMQLPIGKYTIEELPSARYTLKSGIENPQNVTLTANQENPSSVEFENELTNYSKFSQTAIQENHVKATDTPESISVKPADSKESIIIPVNANENAIKALLSVNVNYFGGDSSALNANDYQISTISDGYEQEGHKQTILITYTTSDGRKLHTAIDAVIENLVTITYDATLNGKFYYDTSSKQVTGTENTKYVSQNKVYYTYSETLKPLTDTAKQGQYLKPVYTDTTYSMVDASNPDYVYGYYVFKGWYKSKEYKEDELVTSTTVLTEDTTLYAKYERAYYTLIYKLDGKNPDVTAQHTEYTTSGEVTENQYQLNVFYTANNEETGDIKTMSFAETYVLENGQYVSRGDFKILTVPDETLAQDYKLASWLKDDNTTVGLGVAFKQEYNKETEELKEKPTEITLTAQYEHQKYKITFDKNADDATGTMNDMTDILYTQVLAGNVNLTKNAFVRDGYLFAGWNTQENGLGTSYTDEAQITELNADMTLYAQWLIKSMNQSASGEETSVWSDGISLNNGETRTFKLHTSDNDINGSGLDIFDIVLTPEQTGTVSYESHDDYHIAIQPVGDLFMRDQSDKLLKLSDTNGNMFSSRYSAITEDFHHNSTDTQNLDNWRSVIKNADVETELTRKGNIITVSMIITGKGVNDDAITDKWEFELIGVVANDNDCYIRFKTNYNAMTFSEVK